MINYSIVMRKNPQDKEAAPKAYASAQYNSVMTLEKFAAHIASHGSVYSRADITAVLTLAVDCIHEQLLAGLEPDIRGVIRERVTVDGTIQLGEGSVILPGVCIEGNAVIGRNCKIGPNCYIRGNTSVGDHCHIGQAVEIKNSILAYHVSIGHLSYVGDSIISSGVNFGAGTIISNLRHDGENHRYRSCGQLVSTGRRKFGAVIGEGVHTGINTSIYPGRYLSKGSSTQPGEVVKNSK